MIMLMNKLSGISNLRRANYVEVLPAYDPSQVTALLAANVVYEMLTLVAAYKLSTSSTAATTEKA